MTHKTITANSVNSFVWCETRETAIRKAKELRKSGIIPYIAGKRSKSHADYLDIKIAAIYQNKWNGSNAPWVVAWKDYT